jgi:hypothetical protein
MVPLIQEATSESRDPLAEGKINEETIRRSADSVDQGLVERVCLPV